MKLGFSRRIYISLFFIATVALVPMSCTLNPLTGVLTNLSVKIISPDAALNSSTRNSLDQVHLFATVPSSVAADTADYDCIAFNTTGYGIDGREVYDGEFPLSFFQFGAETPMQNPASVAGLVFQVDFPTLIGIDPDIQRRLIQVYGVFTSNADKSFCEGKKLSVFLVDDDPYAAVYRIGAGSYPNTDGSCTDSDICIVNETKSLFGGFELINDYSSAASPNQPKQIQEWTTGMTNGLSLFEDDDLYAAGSNSVSLGGTATTNLLSTNRVSRVDLYFEITDIFRGRMANFTTNLELSGITAQIFENSGASCTSTPVAPATYSQVSVKYWDGTTLQWAALPRKSGALYSDVLSATNHGSGYTIDNLDLGTIQRTTIDGKKYLILSIRANNTDCVKLSVSPFSKIDFVF